MWCSTNLVMVAPDSAPSFYLSFIRYLHHLVIAHKTVQKSSSASTTMQLLDQGDYLPQKQTQRTKYSCFISLCFSLPLNPNIPQSLECSLPIIPLEATCQSFFPSIPHACNSCLNLNLPSPPSSIPLKKIRKLNPKL